MNLKLWTRKSLLSKPVNWSLIVKNYGFSLLLVAKPHQEDYTDVYTFVWKLCVSYRSLNSITFNIKFPILRFTDSIADLGDSWRYLFTISLYTRSGYHQVCVKKCNQEKIIYSLRVGRKTLLKLYVSVQWTTKWYILYTKNGLHYSLRQKIVFP